MLVRNIGHHLNSFKNDFLLTIKYKQQCLILSTRLFLLQINDNNVFTSGQNLQPLLQLFFTFLDTLDRDVAICFIVQ